MANFNGMENFFLLCAGVGGFFVVLKMLMQLLGGETHTDINHDFTIDGGIDHDFSVEAHHADSDVGFKALSLHGLASFLMMFGLVGLALYRQSGVGTLISLGGAALAGMGTVWVIGKLFQLAGRLQSSGTLSPTGGLLASTGTVYMSIPKGGTGRVMINARNRLREFDAVSVNGEELPTGTAVQVIDVSGNAVVVQSIAINH
jgi:hypothetical protein